MITATVLVLSLLLTSVAFADGAFKNLKAWFGDIKIFSNNKQVQLDVKPFIVDGTTYVPLRAMSNIFDKNINWDGKNLRIDITDKPNQDAMNMAYLTQQIMEKQTKINELETKIAQLESELATTKKDSKKDLRDLKTYLNRQHSKYEKISFDIDLYGNENEVEVEIYVDLDEYYAKWSSLSTSKIEDYIEDVVDDVWAEYKNSKITGFIKNSAKNKKLVEFYINNRGKLVVNIESDSSKYNLDEMQAYLNRNYNKYGGVSFKIDLSGSKTSIGLYVTASKYDLDFFRESEIKAYLKDLYKEITYEFSSADIDGYIEDDHSRYYFTFDSKGNASLR